MAAIERRQASAPSSSPSARSAQSEWTRAYLLAYNAAQLLGWSAVLSTVLFHLLSHPTSTSSTSSTFLSKHSSGLFEVVHMRLAIVQSLAVLEIVHAALGIVRSDPLTTLVQVFSRLFLVWAVTESFPQVLSSF